MCPRIVAVFGATGTQGSSVVKALLGDGTFIPRAVTRNPRSERALKLKELGAQVVQADQWDIQSLKNALTGVEAVFGITDYYDPKTSAQGHASEMLLGKNMVDAAVQTGVQLFIWSSVPHSTRASNGKYPNVHHLDNKANIEDYLRDSSLPHSILHTGWFCENTWNFNCLTSSSDSSSFQLTIPKYDPHSQQYMTWVDRDLGQCALALLKNYKNSEAGVLGETFYAVSDKLSYTQYASLLQQALGKSVRFVTSPTCGMLELDEMYSFQSEFGLYPHAPIPDSRLERLGVKFHPVRLFVEEAKKRYV
ncbi:hypothetical protein F5I97DRAFT_1936520 [Phlebopus sp. FC_14]|nr:hypothetical protein F5I97DRAFT_1936520 [Phlebopus sp. FC_14]